MFEINALEIIQMPLIEQNKNVNSNNKKWDQNCLIWFFFFLARISKNYCHIWNQHPQVCQIAKFREKTKLPKFVTKNALFGYFWGRILKNYYHIWNQHPEVCLLAKFYDKTKMLKCGTKNVLFGYFWGRTLEKYCHIWNQHPQICQKKIFGIGSAFSKGPGLLYKVRLF